MKLLRAVSAICSLAFPLLAWAQAPLAEKMPSDLLLYVGWSGRSLTFDGSLFGQLLAEPEVRRFFAGSRGAVADGLGLDTHNRAVLEDLWGMGGIAWRHPMAVGVFDLLPGTPASPDGAAPGPPRLVGAVIVDLQKDRAEFQRRFQTMLASARKRVAISQATIGTTPYFRFDTRLGPCGMGFVGDLFFLAIGAEAPEKVVALAAGKAKPLSRAPGFVSAIKDVADEGAQIVFYADLVRLRKAVKAFPAPADDAPAPLAVRLDRTLKAVGLDRATAIAGAGSIVDRRMHQKIRLITPAKHGGLLTALSGKALPPASLANVPGDADLVIAIRQDSRKLLTELLAVLAELDPQTKVKYDAVLKWADDRLGMDVPKDLLAHLGDQWMLVSAPSLGGFGTGTVLSVTVKDEAKFAAGLEKLAKGLDSVLGAAGKADAPATGYSVARTTAGEATVYYVAAAGEGKPIPVAPAWAVHKGRFYLAAFPQVIVAALAKPRGDRLDKNPEFLALRKRLTGSPSVLVYVNTPHLLDQLYGAALLGWTAGANRATARGPLAVPPHLLPSLPNIARYVKPDILAVAADAKGITIESYGSLPGSGLVFVAAPLHLAAGRILPELREWAQRAPLATAAVELRAIASACRLYAEQHKSQLPPELNALVDRGMLTPGERGLKGIEYLGAMMTTASPSQLVLAYRTPGEGEKALMVLYLDGAVMRVSLKRFREDLARTRKYLTDQGK